MLKRPPHAPRRRARPARPRPPPGVGAPSPAARTAPTAIALVQIELAAHAGAAGARAHDPRRRSPGRRQAQRGLGGRACSASRAARCARPSARSRRRAWSASRRTAACSSARSASTRPTRSTRCARCSTSSSGDGSPRRTASADDVARPARARRAHGARRRAGRRRRLRSRPISNSTTGWSSSPATPSCSRTYRRLVNELSPVPPRDARRSAARLPVSTREHREIVDRIAAGQAAAAGRALFDHVMASRERMHRTDAVPHPLRARPRRARTERRDHAKPRCQSPP